MVTQNALALRQQRGIEKVTRLEEKLRADESLASEEVESIGGAIRPGLGARLVGVEDVVAHHCHGHDGSARPYLRRTHVLW